MTKDQREKIEAASDAMRGFCYCAGPTCSGCEESSVRLFKAGAEYVFANYAVIEKELLDELSEGLELLWLGDWSAISGAETYGDFSQELLTKLKQARGL